MTAATAVDDRSVQVDPADPRPHLPALDGVRGLAILLVIICHGIRLIPRTSGIDMAAWQVMAAGWVGVDLFFALSGFLITGILYDAKRESAGGYFVNFFARRILRIAPLYYGYLAVYFYLLPQIDQPVFQRMYIEPGVRPMFWFYLYNFWAAIHQGMHGNLGVFWSLCIEEHFYLVWPFVVWLFARRSLMTLCVILGAFSFLSRLSVLLWWPMDHAAYLMTPCRLDGLCAGAFVALCMRDPADWRRLTRIAPAVAIGAAALILGMALGQRHFLDNIDFHGENRPGVDSTIVLLIGLSALALLFGSIVTMTVKSGADHPLQRIFRNPVLRSFGLYSYAMYVFHPLIITLTRAGLNGLGFTMPKSQAMALCFRLAGILVVLLFTYVLAFASYHLFEKHFLSLKRFFPPAKRPIKVRKPAEPSSSPGIPLPGASGG